MLHRKLAPEYFSLKDLKMYTNYVTCLVIRANANIFVVIFDTSIYFHDDRIVNNILNPMAFLGYSKFIAIKCLNIGDVMKNEQFRNPLK